MTQIENYSTRVGQNELFISAPHDESHITAFMSLAPTAQFDQLLEEWRVPWVGGDVDDFIHRIKLLATGTVTDSIAENEITSSGLTFGYVQTILGEGAETYIDAMRKLEIPDERIFYDRLYGRDPACPKLEECLHALRDGDLLIVWKMSRFARSLKQLADRGQIIRSKNAHIKSLTEPLDTRHPESRDFFDHMALASDFEKEANSERTKAGLKEAAAKGRKGGRRGSLTSAQIEDIVRRTLAGEPAQDIAKVIGTSRATIYRYFEGGPKAIFEAQTAEGEEGVRRLIDTANLRIIGGVTEKKRREILRLYKKGNPITSISEQLGFGVETVRAVVKQADK